MRPGTPPQDTGMPDAVETDPAALSSAEDLDQDRLGVDPLEEGMEPTERWSGADRHGTTPYEESTGAELDERLDEEEPDVWQAGADETDYRAEPSADELDYQPEQSVDLGTADPVDVLEQGGLPGDWDAVRRGQSADEAGGSVARSMRTPSEAAPDDDEDVT
jgi:hypothetical protein